MAVEYREVTWLERVGSSVGEALFGVVLIGGSVALLWWNERRTVRRRAAITEVERALKRSAGSANPEELAAAANGTVLHMTAVPVMSPEDAARDPLITVRGGAGGPTATVNSSKSNGYRPISGLAVQRTVEMLQYVEVGHTRRERTAGGGYRELTVYGIEKQWRPDWVDASRFRSACPGNPPLPLRSATFLPSAARLGPFALSSPMLALFGYLPSTGLPESDRELHTGLGELGNLHRQGSWFCSRCPSQNNAHVPTDQAGDIRVSVSVVPVQEVSVIAEVRSGSLVPHITSGGESVAIMRAGNRSGRELLADESSANSVVATILRTLGCVVCCGGFALLLRPVSMLTEPIPILREFAELGTNLGGIVAGVGVSSATIAAAWLFYRPLLSLSLAGVVGATWYARSYPEETRDMVRRVLGGKKV